MGWFKNLFGLPDAPTLEEETVEEIAPRYLLIASLPDADGEAVLNDGKSMTLEEAFELRDRIESANIENFWLKGYRGYYPYRQAIDHLSIRASSIGLFWIERVREDS